MKKTTMKKALCTAISLALVASVGIVGLSGCSGEKPGQSQSSTTTSAPKTQTIVDMEGRSVEIPTQIDKIATFGSVAVINGFVECMGLGDKIANEMPASFRKNKRLDIHDKFAANLKTSPVLETADGIDIEKTMEVNPDICLVMKKDFAEQLEQKGLPTLVLKWNDTKDAEACITLLGEVFGTQQLAKDYNDYFKKTVQKGESISSKVPDEKKKQVLYGDVSTLKNPHIISEWWIPAAAGISVTKDAHTKDALEYTMEQLVSWQPEVILLTNDKVADTLKDPNLASLPAVKNNQVYAVPTACNNWGSRTVENPLMVLWTMNKLYPDIYPEADLIKEVQYFYDHFMGYKMTDDEVKAIINYQ